MNLMIDLETLDTRPTSVILSLAAVPFAHPFENLEPFYVRIDSQSCIELGMSVSESTLAWWEKRDAGVREEAFSGTTPIKEALAQFANYCEALVTPPILWGNGSDFDNVILDHAYNLTGLEKPWRYLDNRCYRTLKNLVQIPYMKPKIAHNALEDAKAQAVHAQQILEYIKGRKYNAIGN